MKTALLLSVLLVAAALAGCANEADDGNDDNTTTTLPTTSTTAGPTTSATPASMTPPATPAVTPGGEGGPPPMMDCEGDYVTPDSTTTRLGMPELSFTAKDPDANDPCYAFVGPANATAGWNVITLDYPSGMEFHIMPMYSIGQHTMDEVMQAFAADEEPEWAAPVGAVGGVTPGQNGSVALKLEAGNYMYFCPIGGHMFQGMMGMLQVTEGENNASEPTADVQIELVDYNFTVPSSLPANASVIKVTNTGTQVHEAPLALLDEGTTAMQYLHALEDPNATAPPPGALVGGVNTLAPGQSVYLLVDLVRGRTYAMACFVESEQHGGAPHLALGMVAEFQAA